MIIENIETLKQLIATVAGDNFDKYKPYLATAERFVKREITGTELFDLATPTEPDLLAMVQSVVAYKGYLEAIPFLDLLETDSGFAVVRNTNLAPASPQRVAELKAATAAKLDEAIEDLLEYLEAENGDIEAAWKGSTTYTLINDNYVSSIREFRKYGRFAGNRIDFIAFIPVLTSVRKLKIEPVISKELSEKIIEGLRDGDLSDDYKKLLSDLRFALAYFANGDEASGQSFVARVRSVLMADPDKYPEFKSSAIYAATQVAERDISEDPFIVFGA